MNTKETNFRQFNIENGPNVDRLLDMFKYAFDKSVSIPGTFVVAECYTAKPDSPGAAYIPLEMKDTTILSIEHESGNDYCLNLSGHCRVALGERKSSSNWDPKEKATVCKTWRELVYARFDAFYNAKTRKGTITFFI